MVLAPFNWLTLSVKEAEALHPLVSVIITSTVVLSVIISEGVAVLNIFPTTPFVCCVPPTKN